MDAHSVRLCAPNRCAPMDAQNPKMRTWTHNSERNFRMCVRTNSCYASVASFYWCVCGQMAVSMAITGRNRAHIVQTYRPEEEQRRWSISGDADAALWRVMMAKTCRRCHFAARTDERFHRGTDRPATSEERGKCEPVTSGLIDQRSSPAR